MKEGGQERKEVRKGEGEEAKGLKEGRGVEDGK